MIATPSEGSRHHRPGMTGADGGRRFAFTIIELLVAIAVVTTLIGLLLPAVAAAREAARATTCRHRLRSLALATLQFHATRECFPPARLVPAEALPPSTVPSATWLVRVMPFVEERTAAASWDESKPYDEQPEPVRARVMTDFLCPTRRDASNAVTPSARSPDQRAACGCFIPGRFVTGGAVVDFGGNQGHEPPADTSSAGAGSGLIVSATHIPGTARWRPRVRHADVTDGLSHTVLAGEMHVPRTGLSRPPDNGPAYDGREFFNMSRVGGLGVPIGDGPDDDAAGMGLFAFGSWHPGACHFAFGDGRVEAVSPQISADLLASLCNRADGAR